MILGQGAAYAIAGLALINAPHTSPIVVSGLQLAWHCFVWNLIPAVVCLRLVHWGHRWLLRWAYRGCPVVVVWLGCVFVFCIYAVVGLVWVRYLVWVILPVLRAELRGGYDAVLEELHLSLARAELPSHSSDPDQLAILASLAADSSVAPSGVGGVLLLLVGHGTLVAAYQAVALVC